MKIGIDARIFGVKEAGVGRYAENLVEELLKLADRHRFVLFVRKKDLRNIKKKIEKIKNANLKLKLTLADVRHYTLREQVLVPLLIKKERVDLMHFPHFNIPIFYFRPYVVTIHDLIKHESKGVTTTTRNPVFYWLKYVFYLLVVWRAVKGAKKIIVPSFWVKEKLVKKYRVDPEKIVVTYEGTSEKFRMEKLQYRNTEETETQKILGKYKIKKPYLIYVGSVYPHKNIERLIQAVGKILRYKQSLPSHRLERKDTKILREKKKAPNIPISQYPSISLVIVCARSVFWERLREKIRELSAQKYVNLLGFVPDEDLIGLLRNAQAFVSPSLSEGFGLPGLEAMACGCPVVCSDIPLFREIYGQVAVYFNPRDVDDIIRAILEVLRDDTMAHHRRVEEGLEQVKKFSWEKCARKTLQVYEEVLGGR